MTDPQSSNVLPFPKKLGFCPQCGWRHPDPNVKLITHCPECDAAPLYPWQCPECGKKQEATAKDLIRWSLTTRRHESPGIRMGFHFACPDCADDAGNMKLPPESQAVRAVRPIHSADELQVMLGERLREAAEAMDPQPEIPIFRVHKIQGYDPETGANWGVIQRRWTLPQWAQQVMLSLQMQYDVA